MPAAPHFSPPGVSTSGTIITDKNLDKIASEHIPLHSPYFLITFNTILIPATERQEGGKGCQPSHFPMHHVQTWNSHFVFHFKFSAFNRALERERAWALVSSPTFSADAQGGIFFFRIVQIAAGRRGGGIGLLSACHGPSYFSVLVSQTRDSSWK